MMINKILLVGGSGYLGRHLKAHLEESGYDIYFTSTKENSDTKHYQVEFKDSNSFKDLEGATFDLVIVLASRLNALVTFDLDHPDLYENTLAYGRFLSFLDKSKVTKKLIYLSSMTVYDKANPSPVVEEMNLEPFHTYGLSKKLAEHITKFFCDTTNIRGVILRSPGIYGGDRQGGIIYNLINKARKSEEIRITTKGLGYWETIHIEDLIDMISQFLRNYRWDQSTEVFNVAYGEEIDLVGTAKHIAGSWGYEQEIIVDQPKDYVRFYLSNEKIRRLIQLKMDFRSRLNDYINKFK